MSQQRKPHIAYGDLEAYRDFVAEHLDKTRIYVTAALDMVSVADDSAMEYHARAAASCLKAAFGALGDMRRHAIDVKEALHA